jgi:hypothetical protein
MELCSIQEQLNTMSSLASDQEFLIVLITSLPESWDQFTSVYLAANNGKLTTMAATNSGSIPSSSSETASSITVDSHELMALILEEYRHRKEKAGESTGSSALFSKSQCTHQHSNLSKDDGCFNC